MSSVHLLEINKRKIERQLVEKHALANDKADTSSEISKIKEIELAISVRVCFACNIVI